MNAWYTIYRNELPFASTEAVHHLLALINVIDPSDCTKIKGTSRRYFLAADESVQFTVVLLPSDDDDCAAWVMNRVRDVQFVGTEYLERLPEFVTETINMGCLSMEDGQMISPSLEQLFD